MSKSYLLWAVIGMIGYSLTATLVKLATQSGRFSSYFVLMISSAMVVATSTTITPPRRYENILPRQSCQRRWHACARGGRGLGDRGCLLFPRVIRRADQRRRPDLWHVYRWRRRAGIGFPA